MIKYLTLPQEQLFSQFININQIVIEANTNSGKRPEMEIYCHEMFVKFAYHVGSIFQLEQGTFTLDPNNKVGIYDYSSVNVLARTVMENYLTAYEVFFETIDDDDKKYQYLNWFIDGYNSRHIEFSHSTPEIDAKIKSEKIKMEKMLKELQLTKRFISLTEKQKSYYLKKKEWIRPSWIAIAEKAGFPKELAKLIYTYLSAYTHTNSNSIIQFSQATIGNNGKEANKDMMNQVFIANALYLCHYMNYFKLGPTLSSDQTELIHEWMSITTKNV